MENPFCDLRLLGSSYEGKCFQIEPPQFGFLGYSNIFLDNSFFVFSQFWSPGARDQGPLDMDGIIRHGWGLLDMDGDY